MVGPAFSISSRQMPASLGVQGPGDSTMPLGFSAMTPATRDLVVAERPAHARAQLAQEVDEIVGEAVVVIDQDEHVIDNTLMRNGCLCVS